MPEDARAYGDEVPGRRRSPATRSSTRPRRSLPPASLATPSLPISSAPPLIRAAETPTPSPPPISAWAPASAPPDHRRSEFEVVVARQADLLCVARTSSPPSPICSADTLLPAPSTRCHLLRLKRVSTGVQEGIWPSAMGKHDGSTFGSFSGVASCMCSKVKST